MLFKARRAGEICRLTAVLVARASILRRIFSTSCTLYLSRMFWTPSDKVRNGVFCMINCFNGDRIQPVLRPSLLWRRRPALVGVRERGYIEYIDMEYLALFTAN